MSPCCALERQDQPSPGRTSCSANRRGLKLLYLTQTKCLPQCHTQCDRARGGFSSSSSSSTWSPLLYKQPCAVCTLRCPRLENKSSFKYSLYFLSLTLFYLMLCEFVFYSIHKIYDFMKRTKPEGWAFFCINSLNSAAKVKMLNVRRKLSKKGNNTHWNTEAVLITNLFFQQVSSAPSQLFLKLQIITVTSTKWQHFGSDTKSSR